MSSAGSPSSVDGPILLEGRGTPGPEIVNNPRERETSDASTEDNAQRADTHRQTSTAELEAARARSGLPYFGNVPGEVADDCWRIGCVNIGRISVGGKLHKDNGALFQDIVNHELDVVLMQEVGLKWSSMKYEERFQARLDHWLEPGQTKSVMGNNKCDPVKKELQWGGTGAMAHGKLSHC